MTNLVVPKGSLRVWPWRVAAATQDETKSTTRHGSSRPSGSEREGGLQIQGTIETEMRRKHLQTRSVARKTQTIT